MTTDTTTDVEQQTTTSESPVDEHHGLQSEVDRLLEFKREWVRDNDMTPCPSCTILVHISDNHCVHCNTDIAPNNALVRENIRRLDEIGAYLDGAHGRHKGTHPHPKSPGLGRRLKHLIAGKPAPEPIPVPSTTCEERHILSGIKAGESLTVLETCGPWHRVQSENGQTGWIYATLEADE